MPNCSDDFRFSTLCTFPLPLYSDVLTLVTSGQQVPLSNPILYCVALEVDPDAYHHWHHHHIVMIIIIITLQCCIGRRGSVRESIITVVSRFSPRRTTLHWDQDENDDDDWFRWKWSQSWCLTSSHNYAFSNLISEFTGLMELNVWPWVVWQDLKAYI